jgi:hypothetical protein
MTTEFDLPDLPYYSFEEVADLAGCEVSDVEHLVFMERVLRPAIVCGRHPEFGYEGRAVIVESEANGVEDYTEWGFPLVIYLNLNRAKCYVEGIDGHFTPTHSSFVERKSKLKVHHFEFDFDNPISLVDGSAEGWYLEFPASNLVISHDELSYHHEEVLGKPEATGESQSLPPKRVANLNRIAGAFASALKYTDKEFMQSDGDICLDSLSKSIATAFGGEHELSEEWTKETLKTCLFLVSESTGK